MTYDETIEIVCLFGELFPKTLITERTPKAWYLVLADFEATEALAAIRTLARTWKSDFDPNVTHVVQAIKGNRTPTIQDPVLAYEASGRVEGDPIAAEAWAMWGGDRHNGMLPDPSCSWLSDAERAQVARERKRFIDIYQSLQLRAEHSEEQMSHLECASLLARLGLKEIKKIA